jgi:hypothetical protein
MNVKVIGEGDQIYPVLSIDRWNVYTLGMPGGGVRTIGGDRLEEVVEALGTDQPSV